MKIQVGVDAGSYTFNAAGRAITFSSLPGLDLSDILAVIHAPTGKMLYQVADTAAPATMASNVLTLHASISTAGMTNADLLTILVNAPDSGSIAANALLTSLDNKMPPQVIPGMTPVDVLASLGVARQLAAGAASVSTALTTTCRRVSMFARSANIRYAIGAGAQTASGTSHWIGSGERLDLDVPANAHVAVLRAETTDGTLELSELL